jgi:hypothetical protein
MLPVPVPVLVQSIAPLASVVHAHCAEAGELASSVAEDRSAAVQNARSQRRGDVCCGFARRTVVLDSEAGKKLLINPSPNRSAQASQQTKLTRAVLGRCSRATTANNLISFLK